MNVVNLLGRLTKDPDIRYSTVGEDQKAIARFTLAVDRRSEGTDFISCVTFGKTAETIEKYVKKGTKIAVEGRIQTGSYTNKEGKTVYTTDVIVNNFEFAESKKEANHQSDGFLDVPDNLDDEEMLPF